MWMEMWLARISYRRRQTLLLMLAFTLMIAFFAAVPLLNEAFASAHSRAQVENAAARETQIRLTASQPFTDDLNVLIDETLGERVEQVDSYRMTADVLCGTPSENCYKIASYPDLEHYFALVDGRWPEPVDDGTDDAPLAEALIARPHAVREGFKVGDTITVGRSPSDMPLRIVGIVEPLEPDASFWDGQEIVTVGVWTEVGTTLRYDFALIVDQAAYVEAIAPVVAAGGGTLYEKRVSIDRAALNAGTLAGDEAAVLRFDRLYREQNPDSDITNNVLRLLQSLKSAVELALAPVRVLAALLLAVIVVQVAYLARVLAEGHTLEWDALHARGARNRRLILIDGLHAGAVVLAALPFGLIGAWLLGLVLSQVGGSAEAVRTVFNGAVFNGAAFSGAALNRAALEGFEPPVTEMLNYGAVAAAAGLAGVLIALTVMVRRRYPPLSSNIEEPAGLNVRRMVAYALMAMGLALMLRVVLVSGGGLTERLQALIREPMLLFQPPVSRAALAADPLNQIGAPLLLAGFALLLISFDVLKRRYLVAVMVVMVSAAAVLTFTFQQRFTSGLQEATRTIAGSDVRLMLDGGMAAPPDTASIEGVTDAMPLVFIESMDSVPRIVLVGVGEGDLLPEAVQQINDAPQPALPGLPLPEDVERLEIRILSEAHPDIDTLQTGLFLTLRDAIGITATLRMTTEDPTLTGEFVTYAVDVPQAHRPPWRVVEMRPTAANPADTNAEFDHTIYLDHFVAVGADGKTSVVADWEAISQEAWQQDLAGPLNHTENQRRRANLTAVRVTGVRDEGSSASFRVTFRVRGSQAVIPIIVNRPTEEPVPVLMSPAMVAHLDRPNQQDRNGDQFTLRLPNNNTLEVDYRLLATVDDLPTLNSDALFVVMSATQLFQKVNVTVTYTASQGSGFTGWNQVWLGLADGAEASESLREVLLNLDGVESVTFATDTYNMLRDAPLSNAALSILFAGFVIIVLIACTLACTMAFTHVYTHVYTSTGANNPAPKPLYVLVPLYALGVGVALGYALAVLLRPFFEGIS